MDLSVKVWDHHSNTLRDPFDRCFARGPGGYAVCPIVVLTTPADTHLVVFSSSGDPEICNNFWSQLRDQLSDHKPLVVNAGYTLDYGGIIQIQNRIGIPAGPPFLCQPEVVEELSRQTGYRVDVKWHVFAEIKRSKRP